MSSQTQKSGQKCTVLNKLSSAASSNVSSRDSSQGENENNQKKQNRKNRRRTPTPRRNNNNEGNYTQKNQNQRSTSRGRRKSLSWRSRSASRRNSSYSNKSNKYQTSKKKAWKSKICRYWKKGLCRFGDQCEWQHYDFKQIDYCEMNKRERYNKTSLNGKYLVQTTTVQYMDENEIMNLIGRPQQIKQSIAIAIKNKNQSKLMKKEIQKEIRKGNLNNEQKIELKKKVIKKYINLVQKDIANEIAMKRIQKKEELKIIRLKKKQQQDSRMVAENEENQSPNHTNQSTNQPYKQQHTQYQDVNKLQQQQQTYQNDMTQQYNTDYQENQFEEIEAASEESDSNLYIDEPNEQQKQQQNQEESQSQQKQQQIKTISNTQNVNKTQQQKLNFTQQQDTDPLQGTGNHTLTMDDSELVKYNQLDQTDKLIEGKLIQRVHAQDWAQNTLEAVTNVEKKYRDTDSNEWDPKTLIVVNINHQLFNKEVTTQTTSKNPKESPVYKTKQAIISAILRYLDKISNLRMEVTSQRTQIFILSRIIENQTTQRGSIWVTGMDKRAKQQIANNNTNPFCVVFQYN